MNPFTILSGDESLAAEITETPGGTYVVRLIDNEARVDAGIPGIVNALYGLDIDRAVRHANAWVTQTPVVLP